MSRISRILVAVLLSGLAPGGRAQLSKEYTLPHAPDPVVAELIARVSAPSVSMTMMGLQSFGTRHTLNSNRFLVTDWVRNRFLSTGATTVYVDSFYYNGSLQWNVIAEMPGDSLPEKQIVIGAHFDSNSSDWLRAPGADDNASGVAAVYEMLRVLQGAGYRPGITLRFVAFGAEEVGLKGSYDYASKAADRGDNIVLMHNFDMISYRNRIAPTWNMSLVPYPGSEGFASLDSAVMTTYTRLLPVRSTSQRAASDSYPFYQYGYSVVYSAGFDRNPYYHSPMDLLDSMDVSYAAEIIRAGLALVLTVERSSLTKSPAVPVAVRLYQNYPNPFNPETEIRYDVAAAGHVTLTVYDALGREVERLFGGSLEPGTYKARWNSSGRASGMYFCRLQSGTSSSSIKMIVIR